jgi:hypothetical protein
MLRAKTRCEYVLGHGLFAAGRATIVFSHRHCAFQRFDFGLAPLPHTVTSGKADDAALTPIAVRERSRIRFPSVFVFLCLYLLVHDK